MRETKDELEITVDKVLADLEQIEPGTLVDVREAWEVAQGMLPGAVHYPLSSFKEYLAQFDAGKSYIFYCAHGVRSLDVAAWLHQNMNLRALSMAGGVAMWQGPLMIPPNEDNS